MEKPKGYETLRAQWGNKMISAREAAVALGVSTPTFIKWVKESAGE